MAYDDIINKNQGAVKSSEIFMDRTLEIIKNSIGETLLKTLEGMMKPVSDALRYNNFLLHSDGQMVWETNLGQPRLRFDADSKANNIRLRLMMLDESAQSRTVDIVIPGTTGANSLTAFNTINMNNNDLVYMELSRSVILAALSVTPALTPAEILLENGIDGGSIASGQRVLKVNMTGNTGMPAMVADLDSILQDSSQTVNIPIAARYDWSDGLTTYSDVWWIPHGIRWPTGSISVVGAVVVSGFNALPNYFVRTETELTQALSLLTNDGGIVTPIDSFTINNPITVPANAIIYGRSSRADGTGNAKITLGTTAGFTLQSGAKLKNLGIVVPSGFGAAGVSYAVTMSGEGSAVEECEFYLQSNIASPNLTNTRCIRTNAEKCEVIRSKFFNLTTAGATAIYVQTGTNHLFLHNRVSNVTEIAYAAVANAVNIRSDYGMVPIGSIIPWAGASYINSSNGSPVYIIGGSGVANLATYLGDGWIICDGRQLPTDSPLRSGGNIYAPNLTNLYLLGSSTISSVGGSNSYNTSNSRSTFNSLAVNFNTNGGSGSVNVDHRHWFKHTHRWAGLGSTSSLTHDNQFDALAQNNNGIYAWGTGYAPYVNNVAHLGIAVNNNIVSLYTSNPIRPNSTNTNNSITGPSGSNVADSNYTGNMADGGNRGFNVNGGSGSVNTASWDAALNNHLHTVNSVFPTYMSVIYIMRVK